MQQAKSQKENKDRARVHIRIRIKRKVWIHLGPTRMVGWLLLASGSIAIAVSIIFESSILAFIGLSLTFWGPLLLYISPGKLVKQILLDSTITPSLANLNQILTELKYQGKSIYLPPEYFKDFETTKIFISKSKNTMLPTPEEIQQQEDKIFLKNTKAVLINPPGLSLSKLFEKTLGTNFTKVDLEYLQQNLRKLFIEDLEIAEDLEMQTKYGEVSIKTSESVPIIKEYKTIHVKITNPVYTGVGKETGNLSRMYGAVGCPLCSAIACALTKATGKPITIERIQLSEDGKIIEATYRNLEIIETQEPTEPLLAEIEPEELLAKAIESHLRPRLLPNLASLSLTVFGSIILAWISQLTWYDLTTWGKDIALVFFGSRTGEAISLGIGMKVIHYFVIGLALLLSGLLTFLRRRSKV